jgi:hypothetical protein
MGNSPSQQTVLGPVIPSSSFSQGKPDSAPSLEPQSGIGDGPGSLIAAVAEGPSGTTESEPAGTISPDAQAAGSAVSTAGLGKETGQEPGGISNGSSGPAVAPPPAQRFSPLDGDTAWARLVSQGGVSAGGDQLAGSGSGRGTLGANGHAGAVISNRGPLRSTAYVSTNVTDGSSPNEWPSPSSADLIASALPFDRTALDRAIDQFFQQFDDLGRGDLAGHGPAYIVMYSIGLASTFAALDVVRRRYRLTMTGKYIRAGYPQARAEHVGFPELPGRWSARPS